MVKDGEIGVGLPRLTPIAETVRRVIDPHEWGAGLSGNDDSYRKWTRHVRTYERRFSMWTRDCVRCDDPISGGMPYIGRIYAESLPKPVRNRKGKLIYSRMWTEYEHVFCPRNIDDAEEFHRYMEEQRREAERAEERRAA